MKFDPYQIINKYYGAHDKARDILIEHSEAVAGKAVKTASAIGMKQDDIDFIREACLLHDIGMFLTWAPSIGCMGDKPYICHGYLGHDLLAREGLPLHALVCERHTGTGLSVKDIRSQNLPLPLRPMEPVSLAEKIIAYADKFFSKDPGKLGVEQNTEDVREKLMKHGLEKVKIFDEWHRIFG
jgi:uncharacterized protein